MMTTKLTLDQKRAHYAMTKGQLYHALTEHLAPFDATLVQLDNGRWAVFKDNQLCSTFLLRNSKDWVQDPRSTDLIGRYKFRSWTILYQTDLEADVDYYVMTISHRDPAQLTSFILTKAQIQQLWNDPRRKANQQGAKFFYFSQLLLGRLGDSRFAKSAKKHYDGWIDLPESCLNNYRLLLSAPQSTEA